MSKKKIFSIHEACGTSEDPTQRSSLNLMSNVLKKRAKSGNFDAILAEMAFWLLLGLFLCPSRLLNDDIRLFRFKYNFLTGSDKKFGPVDNPTNTPPHRICKLSWTWKYYIITLTFEPDASKIVYSLYTHCLCITAMFLHFFACSYTP